MKSEQAKQIADQALEHLAEALGQGRSDALTRYLAALAKFHRYSFGNVLMIAAQRPDATQVAGFHAWKQLGRFVKKGEKGIVIIAPMLIRKDEETDTGADAKKSDRILRFRAVYVFDVAQTDGDTLPEAWLAPPRLDCTTSTGAADGVNGLLSGRVRPGLLCWFVAGLTANRRRAALQGGTHLPPALWASVQTGAFGLCPPPCKAARRRF